MTLFSHTHTHTHTLSLSQMISFNTAQGGLAVLMREHSVRLNALKGYCVTFFVAGKYI